MDSLINKVYKEYNASFQATQPKRSLFRDRLQLYNNINRSDDKININMIRTTIQSLLALYYTNELQVQFMGRTFFSEEEADFLTQVAKFDFDEMDIGITDYLNQWNRFFYGVWPRAYTGWDRKNIKPTYKVLDPISCYPDPNWHSHINNFRFYSVDMNTTFSEFIEENPQALNLDELRKGIVETLKNGDRSANERTTDTRKKQTRMLNPNYGDRVDESIITINNHYTIYKWKPVLVYNYQQKIPLLVKEIKVLEDKNLKFPISLNYREPIANDPRGVCVPDVIEDKQKHIQIYYNLMAVKAKTQALGRETFLDRDIIQKNKWELLQPTIGRKFIPVDTSISGKSVNQLVYSLPDDPISPDVFNMPILLDAQAQKDSWIDAQIRGVADSTPWTATQAQINQQNANVNLALGAKINAHWEKTFWKLWYYFYERYMTQDDKKYIRVNKSLWPIWMYLRKKEFIGWEDPDIIISSAAEIQAMNEKQKADFFGIMGMFMQDPETPSIAKKFIKRKALRLTGQTKSEIEQVCPYSDDEINAKEQVMLINKDIVPEIVSMDEDHLTYIQIFQCANNTPAKSAAISARTQAYVQSGQKMREQMQAQQWSFNGMANMGTNMLLSNSISQGQKQVPSTQQISQQPVSQQWVPVG